MCGPKLHEHSKITGITCSEALDDKADDLTLDDDADEAAADLVEDVRPVLEWVGQVRVRSEDPRALNLKVK